MDRSEKRRLERGRQKLDKSNMKEDEANKQWYSQLPISRKIFIGKFIERRTIENDNLVAAIMDKCMIGAMADDTSIDIKLMKKVVDDCNGYILDYKEFLDKYKDGGFDMIEDKKLRCEVKTYTIAAIKKGDTKVKTMASLKKKYGLPAAELSDMWLECKMELAQDKYDVIINGDTTQAENIVSGPGNTIRDDLKIINTTLEVQGNYNLYMKNKDGVELLGECKGTKFESKEEVGVKRIEVLSIIDNDIVAIEKKLEKMKKDREERVGMFGELEAVFDM